MSTPEPASMSLALRVVISVGLRESALVRRKDDIAILLDLECIQPRAQPNEAYGRARRLVDTIRAVIADLDTDKLRRAMTYLFGTTDHLATLSPVLRRKTAADILGIGPMESDHFLKRQEHRYRDLIADKLHAHNERHLLQRTRNWMALDVAPDPAVAIDWLDRFQYYYRIWTDLSGLSNDIEALTIRKELNPGDRALARYHQSSLWFYSCFLLNLARFVDERGGLWLLSEPDTEQAVADALYRIIFHTPVSQYDEGWLSLAVVSRSMPPNIAIFTKTLDDNSRGKLILARWSAWIERCTCTDRHRLVDCEVHIVQSLCNTFMNLIDSEWNKIASWYNEPVSRPSTETVSVADLFRQYPYDLSELAPEPGQE